MLAVPPAVGIALLKHFARPHPGINRLPVYTPAHPSWKQGTSVSKTVHFIKFAYDTMVHAQWAFPLHDYFPKDSSGPVRVACRGAWQDLRVWGTPVQFKYKWAAQRALGVPTPGVGTFTITCNVTHIGKQFGDERWNTEFNRWVAEQQMEHIIGGQGSGAGLPQQATAQDPCVLARKVHPLDTWSCTPTLRPVVAAELRDGHYTGDEEDTGDESDESERGRGRRRSEQPRGGRLFVRAPHQSQTSLGTWS